ncbi:uncharacterized protein MONBRDRAFT_26045 [Monosiga brevicollis MX1]|uniref:PH domain-containing protein n=1 Tax=Monosiga brevicollis TaxID=81824 RepID=A9V176_MONBE|nr:uncharacterized protein MONBRDRAFT_26045 [Monosiga brevicollis MX1]EDQ88761.1 predicted protein [Monosiga brevicollis MX1]|eukprot:XP_001746374.1 hypothetical protein [Monosiga brevicollis MX1]
MAEPTLEQAWFTWEKTEYSGKRVRLILKPTQLLLYAGLARDGLPVGLLKTVDLLKMRAIMVKVCRIFINIEEQDQLLVLLADDEPEANDWGERLDLQVNAQLRLQLQEDIRRAEMKALESEAAEATGVDAKQPPEPTSAKEEPADINAAPLRQAARPPAALPNVEPPRTDRQLAEEDRQLAENGDPRNEASLQVLQRPRMSSAASHLPRRDTMQSALRLTLDAGVISMYAGASADGSLGVKSGEIPLAHLRSVRVDEHRLQLITAEKTWDLDVASPEQAQHWAQLVQDALEEIALREVKQLHLSLSGTSDDSPSTSTDSPSGAIADTYEGWLEQMISLKQGRERRYAVAGGRTLQLYAKAPAHPGQPPRQRLDMVRLTHLQSVYIEDLSFHLVLPTMTMTFVAPTEDECMTWTKVLAHNNHVPAHLSPQVMQRMNDAQAAKDPQGESKAQLQAMLEETRLSSLALMASSVIFAGFVQKWRHRKPHLWQQRLAQNPSKGSLRYVVLHQSGVLHFFDRVWTPESDQQPRRSLLDLASLVPYVELNNEGDDRHIYMLASDVMGEPETWDAAQWTKSNAAEATQPSSLPEDNDDSVDMADPTYSLLPVRMLHAQNRAADPPRPVKASHQSHGSMAGDSDDDVVAYAHDTDDDDDRGNTSLTVPANGPHRHDPDYQRVEDILLDVTALSASQDHLVSSSEESDEDMPTPPYADVRRLLAEGDDALATPRLPPRNYDATLWSNDTHQVKPDTDQLESQHAHGEETLEAAVAASQHVTPRDRRTRPRSSQVRSSPRRLPRPPGASPGSGAPTPKGGTMQRQQAVQTKGDLDQASTPSAPSPLSSKAAATLALKTPPVGGSHSPRDIAPSMSGVRDRIRELNSRVDQASSPSSTAPALPPRSARPLMRSDNNTIQPATASMDQGLVSARAQLRRVSKRRLPVPLNIKSMRRPSEPVGPGRTMPPAPTTVAPDPVPTKRGPRMRLRRFRSKASMEPVPEATPVTKPANKAPKLGKNDRQAGKTSGSQGNLATQASKQTSPPQTSSVDAGQGSTARSVPSGPNKGPAAFATTPAADNQPTAAVVGDVRARFTEFLDAGDLPEMMAGFQAVLQALGAQSWLDQPNFYLRFRTAVTPHLNYKQKSVFKTMDQQFHHCGSHFNDCSRLSVVVIGAGPVGLRTAIGMAFLGARVRILEKRRTFGRHNILHLWEWVCNDLLKLGANGAEILGKSFFHIGTRRLQLMLARMAFLAGVVFHVNMEAVQLEAPSATDPNSVKLYRLECRPRHADKRAPRLYLPCHVLLDASGASDGVTDGLGFKRNVMSTSAALGLVAHWTKGRSQQERDMEEFSWSRQYNQALFGKLRALGADLENCVYYCSSTHYFIMTPKRQSLLDFGVLREPRSSSSELVKSDNLDQAKLREYARMVAAFFQLPNTCPFAEETGGAMLFDFSSRRAVTRACQVLTDSNSGQQVVVMPVGDALLEPFWPEGLGINRGFHSALDAIWVIQEYFASGHSQDTEALISARDDLFAILKGLSAFTKANIVAPNVRAYDLQPETRYKVWAARSRPDTDSAMLLKQQSLARPYSVAITGSVADSFDA